MPGERTRVFITNGDVFPESLTLLGLHRVEELKLHTEGGVQGVENLQVEGKALSFEIRAPQRGGMILALETKPRRARLTASDFNAYLEEEGLGSILLERESAGEIQSATMERYTKWAKAILAGSEQADGEQQDFWSQPVGQRLEIVPEADPNALSAGETLSIRVLFEEEAAEGVTVFAGGTGGDRERIEQVTDSQGRASFVLPSPGRWYLRGIKMLRVEGDPELQWESFWCTLTFEIES